MHRVSATQVKTFKLCCRKWAWQYIAGHKSPETAAKALGSKTHEILEAYLKGDATPAPDYTWQWQGAGPIKYPGKIALQMINAHLPQPKKGVTEGRIEFSYNGIHYTVIIDCHYLDRTALGTTAVVIDHKTSSDPKKWGMEDKDLEHDPQALLYALCMLETYPDLGLVNCLWNYGSTKAIASAAYVARCSLTPKIIKQRFAEDVEPFAKAIVELKKLGTDPLKLPFNADACGVFGGCEHASRCRLTDKERIGAFIMSETSMVDQLIAEAKKENARPEEKAPDAKEPAQPKPSEYDGINPPESKEPLATEPLPIEPLAVASKPAKKKTAKKQPATKKEAPPEAATTAAPSEYAVAFKKGKEPEPLKVAADAGHFDGLIDEIIDILAERAVARLLERMRATLTQ
jgi:hypothetical protein